MLSCLAYLTYYLSVQGGQFRWRGVIEEEQRIENGQVLTPTSSLNGFMDQNKKETTLTFFKQVV